jgi:drug/metabolite transporter (DMT)-like permease
LVLIPVSVFFEGPRALKTAIVRNGGFLLIIGFFQTFLLYGTMYFGIGYVPASIAAIVIGAQPLLTSAASHAVPPRERLRWTQWATLATGIVGLAVLSISRNPIGGAENNGDREILGILLMLAALSSSTISSMPVSRTRRRIPPFALSSGQFLVGGFMLLAASFFVEDLRDLNWNIQFLLALAWLVTVSSVGISIWYWLLLSRGAKVGALSVWKFIVPVSGAILGWTLIPGDFPDMGAIVGMVLIAASVLGYFRSSRV